jgi:hypothetical protein
LNKYPPRKLQNLSWIVVILLCIPVHSMATTCIMPNDGTGTAQLPPFLCSYETVNDKFMIIDGLPPGTTIEMNGLIAEFSSPPPFEVPGGVLGGKTHQFEALLHLDVLGTGDLDGFTRQITFPILGEIHTAPRTPGDPIQIFQQEFFALQGGCMATRISQI